MPTSGILAYCSSPQTLNDFVLASNVLRAICNALSTITQPHNFKFQKLAHSQLGQGLSHTAMSSPTKTHVHGDIRPIQNKPMRVFEYLWIPVRCAISHGYWNPQLDGMSMNDRVFRHGPGKTSIWTEQPDKLLNGRGDKTQVVPQLLL